jgi:hypothetical protein
MSSPLQAFNRANSAADAFRVKLPLTGGPAGTVTT